MLSADKSDYLKSLADDQGRIEPQGVVDVARDVNNVLHEDFEWDDDAASDAYRIEQARRLIRFVRLPVRYESRTIVAPFYIVDPQREAKTKTYVATTVAAKSREMVAKVMTDEFDRITSSINRSFAIAAAFNQMQLFDDFLSNVREAAEAKRAASAAARKKASRKKPRAKKRAPGRSPRPELRT
jgi:hypothetical protein